MLKSLPFVTLANRSRIPRGILGVYYCVSNSEVLYVGRAKDIHTRWNSTRYGEHHKLKQLQGYRNVRIYWKQEPFWRYKHTEAKEILRLRPPLNDRIERPSKLLSFTDGLAEGASFVIGCLALVLIVRFVLQ